MYTRRFFIWMVVFAIVAMVGVVSVQKTHEAGLDWLGNRNVPSGGDVAHTIGLPRLPDNASREIFETTPSEVASDSDQSVSTTAALDLSPKKILQDVPFISQAPTGKWFDARFQDGCEEASALMAIRWVQGKTLTPQEAGREIIVISEYEQKMFGSFHDTSADDTADRIFKQYFKYDNVEVRHDIDTQDVRKELESGRLILVPLDGRKLGNPYYTPPGPDHHMLVVIGYDPVTDEFITNDPGTRRGKAYRYTSKVLLSALRDYPTGNHEPFPNGFHTAMIVVRK